MERNGVVNRVVEDQALIEEATAFAKQLAKGPTRAHAAHKTLLRTWATGGIAAADEAISDIAIPLFETADVKSALPLAIEALKAGKPRPVFDFKGR
jgi:enoyl-CoA hydratase/carnithine racemase